MRIHWHGMNLTNVLRSVGCWRLSTVLQSVYHRYHRLTLRFGCFACFTGDVQFTSSELLAMVRFQLQDPNFVTVRQSSCRSSSCRHCTRCFCCNQVLISKERLEGQKQGFQLVPRSYQVCERSCYLCLDVKSKRVVWCSLKPCQASQQCLEMFQTSPSWFRHDYHERWMTTIAYKRGGCSRHPSCAVTLCGCGVDCIRPVHAFRPGETTTMQTTKVHTYVVVAFGSGGNDPPGFAAM